MFWKKLASRLDETPSYELSFAGHELGCQKKTSKTQGFSMFFFGRENSCGHLGPQVGPESQKYQLFLSKT